MNLKKIILLFWLNMFLLFSCHTYAAEENELCVVIDPGHGGSNHGANYNGWQEEEITLETAEAFKQRLEEYNNVRVCLTREDNSSLSLEERADFAERVGADIMISVHYNASENNNLYGTEVWVPSTGYGYAVGKGLGERLLAKYSEEGYCNRCVKTKVGDDLSDYYGVIRNSAERGIPCIIMEHCFIDNAEDEDRLDENRVIEFGVWDADCVAEYYNLSLAGEPQAEQKPVPNIPEEILDESPVSGEILFDDRTEPHDVGLRVVSQNADMTELELSAADDESKMLYYDYSTDGGETWTELLQWGENEKCLFSVPTSNVSVKARAYNSFDLFTECALDLEYKEVREETTETVISEMVTAAETADNITNASNEPVTEVDLGRYDKIAAVCFIAAAAAVIIIISVALCKKI